MYRTNSCQARRWSQKDRGASGDNIAQTAASASGWLEICIVITASGAATRVWLAAGVRTPFAKAGGALADLDAPALSRPVIAHMTGHISGRAPDLLIWGTVIPSLSSSNIARELVMECSLPPTTPACTTVLACCTSMAAAIEAAGMLDNEGMTLALVGGAESMSRVPIGLGASLSDRIRGMSMGEHTELTAQQWQITRLEQDELALLSHNRAIAAWDRGFFDDLVIPVGDLRRDGIPMRDTSMAKLASLPSAFDSKSAQGLLTAGNSSALSDGAAGLWVASAQGLQRLAPEVPRARLVDWEIAAIDFRREGLLMAPAVAIPRLLARRGMTYADVDLWEIHEAFAAQVAFHIKALEDPVFLRASAAVEGSFGPFPRERVNPNGGSVALGHAFAATGARILSQAIKELAALGPGRRAIVSICADGGQGTVALLES